MDVWMSSPQRVTSPHPNQPGGVHAAITRIVMDLLLAASAALVSLFLLTYSVLKSGLKEGGSSASDDRRRNG
jgi:hypothetical protein